MLDRALSSMTGEPAKHSIRMHSTHFNCNITVNYPQFMCTLRQVRIEVSFCVAMEAYRPLPCVPETHPHTSCMLLHIHMERPCLQRSSVCYDVTPTNDYHLLSDIVMGISPKMGLCAVNKVSCSIQASQILLHYAPLMFLWTSAYAPSRCSTSCLPLYRSLRWLFAKMHTKHDIRRHVQLSHKLQPIGNEHGVPVLHWPDTYACGGK